MDVLSFFATLRGRYWQWGTLGATPRGFDRYAEVVEAVKPMTSPATLALLDHAARHLEPGECYLEVGTWRGGTLIGALRDNALVQGYAVDNAAMTDHDKDGRPSPAVWAENVARFGVADRATYIDGATPEVWARLDVPPVGVYLFDGDKATPEAAWDGLGGVVEHLAPRALIILDDANDPNVRAACHRFTRTHADRSMLCLDLPTPSNCWPSFWNGVMAIAWGYTGE